MASQKQQVSRARQSPTLISLPSEILRIMFAKLQEVDNCKRGGEWFEKPENRFMGLMLTCKRLYCETEDFWPHYNIPFSRLPRFFDKYSFESQRSHATQMQKYRSVSLELDLQATNHSMVAKFLREAQYLEELRLYFKGTDLYGTSVFSHGCGYDSAMGREQSLPREAQRNAHDMLPLWSAILNLTRLRVLVISNANFQLFQSVFKNKPNLQFVHLTADPRSEVHTSFNVSTLGRLIEMPKEYFPPMKTLHLSANSILNAPALPSNCALTLQHLTWTVPATSLSSNGMLTSSLNETSRLFDNLRLNARRLHTLRICIADKGYMLGGHRAYGDIHAALTLTISHLVTLRHYELHMTLGEDVWNTSFGEAMAMAIPTGLKRLYASEKWINLQSLERVIASKYLFADKCNTRRLRNAPHDRLDTNQKSQRWMDVLRSRCQQHDHNQQHEPSEFVMWINPTSYTPIFHDEREPPLGDALDRKVKHDLFLPGIIGEDFNRKDYIPLRTGNLGFVTYTYEEELDLRNPEFADGTKMQRLLHLNGRLLDRERNLHLKTLPQGGNIPFKTYNKDVRPGCTETATKSDHFGIKLLLHALLEVEATDPRDGEVARAELAESPITDFDRYFGLESEAFEVFRNEPVVPVIGVQPYRYCELSDIAIDDQCHWSCPEADVPTQAAWDDMCAKYRASKGRK